MFRGYLQLGGVEVINSERTYQYVRNNLPQFPLKDCDDCADTLHQALGDGAYDSPLVDDAPWVEQHNPATQGFYGFYPLELTGSLDDTTTAPVVEGILDGGYVGSARAGVREMRYRGLMIAKDRLGLHSGMTWLKSALHPPPCQLHGGSCAGSTACLFAACPEITLCYEDAPGDVFSSPTGTVSPSQPFTYLFNEGGLTTARILIPVTDGFAFQWGARRTDGSDTWYEQHGPVVSKRTNFLMNPTFRQSTSLWTPSGQGTLTRPTTGGVDGGAFARMDPDVTSVRRYNWMAEPSFENFTNPEGAGWYSNAQGGLTQTLSETAPQGLYGGRAVYDPAQPDLWLEGTVNEPAGQSSRTVSFYIGESTHAVRIELVAADQTILQTKTYTAGQLTAPWTRVFITNTGSTAVARVRVTQLTPDVAPESLWVDGFLAEPGTTMGSYFDGGSTDTVQYDYAWTGAAHTSTSTRSQGGTVVATNLMTTPSFEAVASGSTILRTNLFPDPNVVTATATYWGATTGALTRVPGDAFGTPYAGRFAVAPAGPQRWAALIALTPGQLYTVRFRARGSVARTTWSLSVRNTPTGTAIPPIASNITIDANVRAYEYTFTAGAATGSSGIYLVNASGVTDEWIEVADFMVEAGDTLGRPFFSGDTPDANGFDFAWTGTANASTSTVKGSLVTVRTNYVLNPRMENSTASWSVGPNITQTAAVGGTVIDIPTVAVPADNAILFPTATVGSAVAGESYFGRYEVTVPAGYPTVTLYVNLFSYGNNISAVGTPVTIAAGETKTLTSAVNLLAAGTTGVRPLLSASTTVPVGARIIVRKAQAERSTVALSGYFDGATPAAGDFTHGWTGTADLSTSVEQAVAHAGYLNTGGSSTSFLSTEWAASGLRALRTRPVAANAYADVLSFTGAAKDAMLGKTYTILATSRATAAIAGGTAATRRTFNLRTTGAAASFAGTAPVSANVAGVETLRQTFTIPNDPATTAISLRLYHGGGPADVDVWWDEVVMVEGTYTGPYFDGSTPSTAAIDYRWVDGDPTKGSVLVAVTTSVYQLRSADTPTTFGTVIASFYLRSTADPDVAHVQAEIVAAADNAVLGVAQFDPTSSWARYSLTAAFGRNVFLRFTGSRGQIEIDQVMIEAGATRWPYFDGSTVGFNSYLAEPVTPSPEYTVEWTGTPDASPSTMTWTAGLNPDNPNQQILTLDEVCDEEWQIVLDGISGSIPDGTLEWQVRPVIPAAVQAGKYERNFHDVSTTSGPTVLQEFSFSDGAAVEVEFTVVAGTPFAYGTTDDLIDRVPITELQIAAWEDVVCAVPDDTPILDPDCPPVPAAPRPPSIPNECVEEITQWQRAWYSIPAEAVSGWSQMLPTILLTTKAQDVRQVRVRFTPNPFDRNPDIHTRANRVPNPSLYTDSVGWTQVAGTSARVGTGGPENRAYWESTATAAHAIQGFGPSTGNTPNYNLVNAGETVWLSMWVRASAARQVRMRYAFLDAGGVVIGAVAYGPAVALSANTWTRLVSPAKLTAPATAVRMILGVVNAATPAEIGEKIAMSMALIEPSTADTAGAYFDGNTADAAGAYYGWSGAVSASASYATHTAMDPCAYCSEFILSYLPANSELTVDGLTKTAFASIGGGGAKPASHLLYGSGGTPMSWSSLSCGISYVMTVDVPAPFPGDALALSLSLTQQE